MNKTDTAAASLAGGALLPLILAPLLWAGNFAVGRIVHLDIAPLPLNALRWAAAAALLLPVLLWHRRAVWRTLRERWRAVLLLSGLGVVGFNTVLYAGLARTTASTAGVVFGLTPLLILLCARLAGGRAPARTELGGALVAFAGVALVIGGAIGWTGAASLGALIVLAAALIWTAYTLALRHMPLGLPPLPALGLQAAVGAAIMLPFVPHAEAAAVLARPEGVAAVAYLALGASILAFCFWLSGVARAGPQRAGAFLNLIPVFSVLLGAALLGERPGPLQLAGLGLVVGGVTTVQLRPVP